MDRATAITDIPGITGMGTVMGRGIMGPGLTPTPADITAGRIGGTATGKAKSPEAMLPGFFVVLDPRRHCEEQGDEAIHSFFFVRRNGLLRGACHRARIRATRWLAMTKV
jgi:hypothetical protein